MRVGMYVAVSKSIKTELYNRASLPGRRVAVRRPPYFYVLLLLPPSLSCSCFTLLIALLLRFFA